MNKVDFFQGCSRYSITVVCTRNSSIHLDDTRGEVIIPPCTIALIKKSFDVITCTNPKDIICFKLTKLHLNLIKTVFIENIFEIGCYNCIFSSDFILQKKILKSECELLNRLHTRNIQTPSNYKDVNNKKIIYFIFIIFGIDFLLFLVDSFSEKFSDYTKDVLLTNLAKKWKLDEVAKLLGVDNVKLKSKLSSENTSLSQILLDLRMFHAITLLLESQESIKSISRIVGFTSPSYFTKVFKKYYGFTPKMKSLSH